MNKIFNILNYISKMSLSRFNITCFKRENKKEGKIIRKLGEGSKGNVYLLENSNGYFVRKISISEHSMDNIENEYKVLTVLKDVANIPNVYRRITNLNRISIDFEYIEGYKSVDKIYTYLGYEEIKDIIRKVSNVIKNSHDKGIVHRDIKMENILYNFTSKNVYVIDWDCSYNINSSDNNIKQYGTIIFNPPEMFDEKYEDYRKIDVWQIGAMFFDMISKGKYDLFDSNLHVPATRDGKLMKNIMHCNWNRKHLKYKNLEFLFELIFKPENERISLDELIKELNNI